MRRAAGTSSPSAMSTPKPTAALAGRDIYVPVRVTRNRKRARERPATLFEAGLISVSAPIATFRQRPTNLDRTDEKKARKPEAYPSQRTGIQAGARSKSAATPRNRKLRFEPA